MFCERNVCFVNDMHARVDADAWPSRDNGPNNHSRPTNQGLDRQAVLVHRGLAVWTEVKCGGLPIEDNPHGLCRIGVGDANLKGLFG